MQEDEKHAEQTVLGTDLRRQHRFHLFQRPHHRREGVLPYLPAEFHNPGRGLRGRPQCHLPGGSGTHRDAFDISAAGIEKAREIARLSGIQVNFFRCDLKEYIFEKVYDAILSHGVLHLPERPVRDRFIRKMQEATRPGGYNVIGIFTDRLPATPDNAPFTHSLFAVGELPDKYRGWELVYHQEGTFTDTHPGGIHHEHAYERIIARHCNNFIR